MGFFDLFKGRTSETKAVNAVDGYEAAAYSRDRSQVYSATPDESANPSSFTRAEVLRLSRYLVNNFPLAERILSVAEIYGVGAGLIASASTTDSVFNQAASQAFDKWANTVFCSSNNQYTCYEIQKLLAREILLAGEVFIVLVKADTGYPQLMLISSENVRHSGLKTDTSIDGLYVDSFGKVIAYNIFTGKTFQKVDAANVIHLLRHKHIGQLRGIGSFAASLNSMRDTKDLMLLEKKAIKVHSMLALVVEKAGGEATNGGILGELAGSTASVSGKPNVGLERAFGAAVTYLDKGEKVTPISSDRSTQGFQDFLEILVRDVCLNISIPYEFLVNSEKLTGTGIRFVLSDAAFAFRDIQDRIIDGGLNRIYSWVIASFIKDGKLPQPDNDLPWAVSFTRPLSITVDQQRVSTTEIQLLQNSLLTFESFYSARGKDWREELRQHAKEEQFLDELTRETGVSIDRLRVLPGGSSAAVPAPAESEPAPPAKAAA